MILVNKNYVILKSYNTNISPIIPKQINKKCGEYSIIFISYLSAMETSQKIENICNILKEK